MYLDCASHFTNNIDELLTVRVTCSPRRSPYASLLHTASSPAFTLVLRPHQFAHGTNPCSQSPAQPATSSTHSTPRSVRLPNAHPARCRYIQRRVQTPVFAVSSREPGLSPAAGVRSVSCASNRSAREEGSWYVLSGRAPVAARSRQQARNLQRSVAAHPEVLHVQPNFELSHKRQEWALLPTASAAVMPCWTSFDSNTASPRSKATVIAQCSCPELPGPRLVRTCTVGAPVQSCGR